MLPIRATYTHKSGKVEEAVLIVKIDFDDVGPIIVWIDHKEELKLGRLDSFSKCSLERLGVDQIV